MYPCLQGGKIVNVVADAKRHSPPSVLPSPKIATKKKDPDGYEFELLKRGLTSEPLCQVSLRIGDLDCAIIFNQKVSIFYSY
ncbi:hypothetical protein PIB30_038849 [Stylosanthes scabra]|uniref:Uncharacterized protein n=1 Tax=Stylosanthes scabra TaxID=79078 RepID=A0ABU6VE38_9FABA|nr:hypothetical protein [Stylosanthes scabra]